MRIDVSKLLSVMRAAGIKDISEIESYISDPKDKNTFSSWIRSGLMLMKGISPSLKESTCRCIADKIGCDLQRISYSTNTTNKIETR